MDSDDDITLSRPSRGPSAPLLANDSALPTNSGYQAATSGAAALGLAAEDTQAVTGMDASRNSSASGSDSSSDSDSSSSQSDVLQKASRSAKPAVGSRRSASSTSASSDSSSSSSSSGSGSSSDSDSSSSSSSSNSSTSADDKKSQNDDDGFVRRKNKAGKPVRRSAKPRAAAGPTGAARGRGRAAGAGGRTVKAAASRSSSRSSGSMSSDSAPASGKKGAQGKKKKAPAGEGMQLGKRAAAAAAEEAQWGKTGLWTEQDEERERKLEEVRHSFRIKLIEAMQEEEATKDADLRDSAADAEMVLAGRAQRRGREQAWAAKGREEATAAIATHAEAAQPVKEAAVTEETVRSEETVQLSRDGEAMEVDAAPSAPNAHAGVEVDRVAAGGVSLCAVSQAMVEDTEVATAVPLSLLPPEGTASQGDVGLLIPLVPIYSSQGVRIEESMLEASMVRSQEDVGVPSQAVAQATPVQTQAEAEAGAKEERGGMAALDSPASKRSAASSASSSSSSSGSDSDSGSSSGSRASAMKDAVPATAALMGASASSGPRAQEEADELGPFTPIEGLTAAWRRSRQALVERLHSRILSIEQAVAYEEHARALERDKAIAAKAGATIMSDLHSKVTAVTATMMRQGKQQHEAVQMKGMLASKGMFGDSSSSAAAVANEVVQRTGLNLRFGASGGNAAGGSPVAQTQSAKSNMAALVHLHNPLEHLLHAPASAVPPPVTTLTVGRAAVRPGTRPPAAGARERGSAAVVNLDSSDDDQDDAMEGLAEPAGKVRSASTGVGASAPGSSPEGTTAHAQGATQKGPDIAAILDAMATLKEEYDKRDGALREIGRKASEAARRRAVEMRARQKAAAQAKKLVAKKGKLLKTGAMDDSDGDNEDGGSDREDGVDGPVDEESTTALVADYLPPLLQDMFSLGEGLGTTSAGTAAGELLQAFATGRAVSGMTAGTTATVLQRSSKSTGVAIPAPPAPPPSQQARPGSTTKARQAEAAPLEPQSHPRFMARQGSLGAVGIEDLSAAPDASTPLPSHTGAPPHSQHALSRHAALAAFASGHKAPAGPLHALVQATNAGVGGMGGGGGRAANDPPMAKADKLRREFRAMLQAASARQESQLEARKRGFKDAVALGLEKARRTLRDEYSSLSVQLEELLQAAGGQAAAEAYLMERAEKQAKAAIAARIAAQASAAIAAPGAHSAVAGGKPAVVRTYGRAGTGVGPAADLAEAGGSAPVAPASKVLQFRVNDEGEGEYVEALHDESGTSAAVPPLGSSLLPMAQPSPPAQQEDNEDDFAAAEDDAAVAVKVARSSEEFQAEEEQAALLRDAERAAAAALAEEEILLLDPTPTHAHASSSAPAPKAGNATTGAALAAKGKLGAMFAKQALQASSHPSAASAAPTTGHGMHGTAPQPKPPQQEKEQKERGLSDDEDALAEAIAAEDDSEDSEEEEEEQEQAVQPKFRRLKKGGGAGQGEGGDAASVASSAVEDNMQDQDEGEDADDEGAATSSKPAASRAILDEDDEEFEAARAAQEEAQARLERPQTYADMIRAEAEAERRKKLGQDKGKRGKKYVDEQAELSDEEKMDGLGRFGAGKGQTLLGADGKLVTRLVEEAEEARALGLGADVEAELAGAVVDELSEDEAEGDHDRMFRDLEAQKEKEELRRLQKALATGSMGALRARGRRGGEAAATFARDAAQMDDMEQAEEADDLENDELALEERELERQRAAGPYAKSFIAGEEDDEDGEEGEAAEAARLAKELATRDAAAMDDADSEDDDGEFDFESAMRKKAAAEARAERIRRERAQTAKLAEQQEAAAVQYAQSGAGAGGPQVDPEEEEHRAHLQRLKSALKGGDSDSEEDEVVAVGVVGGGRGPVGARPASMAALFGATGRQTVSLSIQAPPLTSKTSASATPFAFGATPFAPAAPTAVAPTSTGGAGAGVTPALSLPTTVNVLSRLMGKAKSLTAAREGGGIDKAHTPAALLTSFGGPTTGPGTAPAFQAQVASRVGAASLGMPALTAAAADASGASRAASTTAFLAPPALPSGGTALGRALAPPVKGPVSFGATTSAPSARPLLLSRQGSLTGGPGMGQGSSGGPSALFAGMMSEASMMGGGAASRMGSSLGASALGMPGASSFPTLGMPLGLGLGLTSAGLAPSLGTGVSAGGRLAVTAAGKKGLVLSKKDSNRQAPAPTKGGSSLEEASLAGFGVQGGHSSTGMPPPMGSSMLGKRPASGASLGGTLFQALDANKKQRSNTGGTIGK